jgi:uncharacterized protein YcbX
MISLADLSVYPVKSFGGESVAAAALDRFGLHGDRRWMLVDSEGNSLTQRELAAMSLIKARHHNDTLHLTRADSSIAVQLPDANATPRAVTVWGDQVVARDAGNDAAQWCSESLGVDARLVHMSDDCQRGVDPDYASSGETVSFADGFPLLLISQASLDDFNQHLVTPAQMNRFRPNLVVSGCEAYAEDGWREIRIGELHFEVAKPCSRCVMPSIDQQTGEKNPEILRALATHRRGENRKTYFGQNLLYRHYGELRLGDEVEVLA